MNNNNVRLVGTVSKAPTLSHEVRGEKFYSSEIAILRKSEIVDFIPVIITESLLKYSFECGNRVLVEGEFRSFNKRAEDSEKGKVELYVFVQSVCQSIENHSNYIELTGFICKEPNYRETPLGREICDTIIAVNRLSRRSDYLPCISWGRYARIAGVLDVGTKLKLIGRIQSREYTKQLGDGTTEQRIAYEVSVNSIQVEG